jgi:hypothetical protein
LERLLPVTAKLLPPGGIRQAIAHARRYALRQCLQLNADYYPFLWLGAVDGVYVLSRSRAAPTLPLTLHFIRHYQFDKPALKLTDQLPPFTDWISRPLLNQQGLFVVATDSLHFVPAHGHPESYPTLHRWSANRGERLLSIGLEPSRHPLLLIGTTNQGLQLVRGNAQAGEWGTRPEWRIPLAIPAREGVTGYSIGTVKQGTAEQPIWCGWLYDGAGLTLIDLDDVNHGSRSFPLGEPGKPVKTIAPRPLLKDRPGSFFDPFFITMVGMTQPSLVLPLDLADTGKLQAGVWPVFDGGKRPEPLHPATWILPDPWQQGAVLGSEQGFWRMQSPVAAETSEHKGDFSAVTPLLLEHCFIAQTSPGAAGSQAQAAQLLIFAVSQVAGQYQIKLAVREPLPDTANGTPLDGLPPLYAAGEAWVALRGGSRDEAPITVYAVQITQQ